MDRVDPVGGPEEKWKKAEELLAQIYQLIAGNHPDVVGFALADCLATWLAGHVIWDEKKGTVDEKQTAEVRDRMLKVHLRAMKRLVPHNFKIYVEHKLKEQIEESRHNHE